jgi:hypothetical protein
LQGWTCIVLGMENNTQTATAKNRGWDRGFTARRTAQDIDADTTARNLYPDTTELQNACAAGFREGWEAAG